MLLLDHNLPHQLRDLLISFGLEAESTKYRGWQTLRNGDLVSAAYTSGFRAIITRDRKFAESAARALSRFPEMAIEMAIVIVTLDQRSWRMYGESFRSAWAIAPIVAVPGKVIVWPS